MSAARSMNTYLNNHYEGMSPERLIQMLYQGALKHIEFTRQGIREKNIKKRGEHLGRVIAIVTELYSSLDPEMKDESTEFLRGLYSSILAELPKVSLNNDVKILDTTYRYLERLKDIWEQEVMTRSAAPTRAVSGKNGYAKAAYPGAGSRRPRQSSSILA